MDLLRKGIIYIDHVILNPMVILNICSIKFICFLETNFSESYCSVQKS